MRFLVTRPEPDASRGAEALAARGHEAVLAPLLKIEFAPDVPLDLAGAQALIVTSRNALRALATRHELEHARKLPLFAVGEATARAARELGFAILVRAPGTAAGLPELIGGKLDPKRGSLLQLAGENLAFDLKTALEAKGFTLHQPVLYRAVPAEQLPARVLSLLKAGELDGAILLSPRTARTFAALIDKHGAVRAFHRPPQVVTRLSATEVLAMIDANLGDAK